MQETIPDSGEPFLTFNDTEAPTIVFALGGLRLFFVAKGKRASSEELDATSLSAGLEVVDRLRLAIEHGQRRAQAGKAFEAELVKAALHHTWTLCEMGELAHDDLPRGELYSADFTREQVLQQGPSALAILASVHES